MKKKTISIVLVLSMIMTVFCTSFSVSAADAPTVKNIIYMIPDGGAMAPFYLADAVKQAGGFDKTKFPNVTSVEKGEMYLKDYLVGAEKTYSANADVTDSAAAGTALSSGYKTNNSYVGITPDKKPRANILEACQDIGKNTGMVVTYEWTNATPAAFSAHDISRANMTTMSEQIVNQDIDVVLGNTHDAFKYKEWFTDSALKNKGYKVIKDRDMLNAVKPGDRIWGKLPAAYYDTERAATTPNLAELTQTAITALNDGNKNGFFLMVEGSAVDGGGHGNDAVHNVSEYLAFDAACKVAIEFAKNRTDTIVVVAPDHDTGGLSYDYSNINQIVKDIQSGTNSSLVKWETGGHTARNGGVFMYLPEGISYPTNVDPTKKSQVATEFYNAYGNFSAAYPTNAVNVIENTTIVNYVAGLIGVDFDSLTNKLFVDVTDMGKYNPITEMFTFNDKDIKIKRNASSASIYGIDIDLGGEIALYIEGRFYVPQKLFTIESQLSGGYFHADYKTGRITYSGNLGAENALVSTVVTKPEMTLDGGIKVGSVEESTQAVAAIEQTTADSKGVYSFNYKVDRLAGEYTVYTNYSNSPNEPMTKNFTFKNTIPTMTVTKDGNDIWYMKQIQSGDKLDFKLSGFDLDDDYPGLIIVAQYVNGVLASANYTPIVGGSANVGSEIEGKIGVLPNAEKIVIHYWNQTTHVPLTASYIID